MLLFKLSDIVNLTWDPDLLGKVFKAVLILFGGLILGPLTRTLILRISQKVWDKGAMTFIGSFANISIIIIAVIIALDTLGINTSVLVGAFSALGLGISLALKDNMANVAGGLQLLITRPFVVGDFVKVGSHEGYVKGIELMYTTLETFDNEEIIVPNAKMISKIVSNHTHNPVRRVDLKIPVFKMNDVRQIENVLKSIVDKDKRVLHDPAYTITVDKIKKEFVNVYVYVYCLKDDYWPLRYDLYNEAAIALKDINPYILEVETVDDQKMMQAGWKKTVEDNKIPPKDSKAIQPEAQPAKKEGLFSELLPDLLEDKKI